MDISSQRVSPTQFLMDPNNYRFHDISSYRPVGTRSRYSEPDVQDKALRLLQTTESFELGALKDSILTNGFVPLEQIVVERFNDGENPLFLVIEGNRRVAAVKTLLQDHQDGAIDIPEEILTTLRALPVIEVLGTEAERRDYQQTLMAIRHIRRLQTRLQSGSRNARDKELSPVSRLLGPVRIGFLDRVTSCQPISQWWRKLSVIV